MLTDLRRRLITARQMRLRCDRTPGKGELLILDAFQAVPARLTAVGSTHPSRA